MGLDALTLDIVRVEVEGPTASFRYPHFLSGRQPSYPMPPPSTIYGLVAGALGHLPDADSFSFAYRFECEGPRVDDLERVWIVGEPKSKRDREVYVHQIESNVLKREWLVAPRLTLYLAGSNLDALYQAFRTPHYVPVLGRSQDLVSFQRVDRMKLERREVGRFDPSLLPIRLRDQLAYGSSVHMPRFINPADRRDVAWGWFIALDRPVAVGPELLFEPELGEAFWADPDTRDTAGRERLLTFHSFLSDDARA